jgi:hypothetical protein
MLRRAVKALDHHWFAPASLTDLAVVRIVLVAAQLLVFMPSLDWTHEVARYLNEDFVPIPALKVLMLPFGGWGVRPSAGFLTGVTVLAVISGILAILGLGTRVAMLIFAACNTLLVSHVYSYGDYHHPEALMIIALWVLAAAPAGRALSLDRVLARRSGRGSPEPGRSPDARWPLRLIQWNFVLVYLSAGLSKLASEGFQWMNGYTMSYYLLQHGVREDIPLSRWLQEHLVLSSAISVVAVGFELSFAVCILRPRLAWLYVAIGTALHIGIYLTMEAPFFQYIYLYIVFIESLRRYGPHLSLIRRLRPAPKPLVAEG